VQDQAAFRAAGRVHRSPGLVTALLLFAVIIGCSASSTPGLSIFERTHEIGPARSG
jgi:hypothetical protein